MMEVGASLRVTFGANKVFNANASTQESRVSSQITISACHGATGIPSEYDYTKLEKHGQFLEL